MNSKLQTAVSLTLFVLLYSGCKEDSEVNPCENTSLVIEFSSIVLPTSCDTRDAEIQVSAVGGNGPYVYFLNTGSRVIRNNTGFFKDLFPGVLEIRVNDSNNCTSTLEFEIRNEAISGVSYINDIIPILDTNCNLSGCHNGDLGTDRDWRTLEAIRGKLNNFQRILWEKKMPPAPNALLNNQDLSKILCWIADGAQNN